MYGWQTSPFGFRPSAFGFLICSSVVEIIEKIREIPVTAFPPSLRKSCAPAANRAAFAQPPRSVCLDLRVFPLARRLRMTG
jgi:hypothetical protein